MEWFYWLFQKIRAKQVSLIGLFFLKALEKVNNDILIAKYCLGQPQAFN